MAMAVDPARKDEKAGGIDRALGGSRKLSHCDNPAAADPDVASKRIGRGCNGATGYCQVEVHSHGCLSSLHSENRD